MTERQSFLHQYTPLFFGTTQAWSHRDGQIRVAHDLSGFYHSDVRVVSRAVLTIGGEEPELIGSFLESADRAVFLYAARSIDSRQPDPLVTVRRVRQVRSGTIRETIELASVAASQVSGEVRLDLQSDLAGMDAVKSGAAGRPISPSQSHLGWADGHVKVDIGAVGSAGIERLSDSISVVWRVDINPGGRAELTWSCEASDSISVVSSPADPKPEWTRPTLRGSDPRLARLVGSGFDSLEALRCVVAAAPDDTVLAGGVPWFQTLFGRDAIWAAEMLLPVTWKTAASTLSALAALQGTRVDAATAEQPGKILHEIRRAPEAATGQRAGLPPVYYGTIDATGLWVGLLHDAWQAGMPRGEVAALIPNLERALRWIVDYGDADGDGLLEYFDETGAGLSNQGWKDSGDSVQFRDGRLATGAIALVEVQAYAYRALVLGADLLQDFGREGSAEFYRFADRLRTAFHERFWITDQAGEYLAMALDGGKQPVDAVASNMGHVIGSGLLDAGKTAAVVERLMGDDLFSGFGVRTLSTNSDGYWPLRYHGGTVWPHENALFATRMLAAGHDDAAERIASGLLDAAEAFDYRLPELFAGYDRRDVQRAMPYPAACPIVCWSAACVVPVASALGALPNS